MSGHGVCPWWAGYFLLGPVRRLFQDPAAIVAPYVAPGMTVLEPGPGMGFFTLEIARRVGPEGRVVTVDVQPRMTAVLRRRAAEAGLATCIDARDAGPDSMGLDDLAGCVDLVFAFAVVHEMPSAASFFAEAAQALKTDGRVLLVEPAGHVDDTSFAAEIAAASEAGLAVVERPRQRKSHAALLAKTAGRTES